MKVLTEDKDKEIADLAFNLKVTRSKLTDLTLIEEKTQQFVADSDLQIDANKKSLHDYLRNFLRIITSSDSLCEKITMRRRDKGYELQNKLMVKP